MGQFGPHGTRAQAGERPRSATRSVAVAFFLGLYHYDDVHCCDKHFVLFITFSDYKNNRSRIVSIITSIKNGQWAKVPIGCSLPIFYLKTRKKKKRVFSDQNSPSTSTTRAHGVTLRARHETAPAICSFLSSIAGAMYP